MVKKILAFSIVSALAFIACTSENATNPLLEYSQNPSSSSIQPSLNLSSSAIQSSTIPSSSAIQNANDALSSSSVVYDTIRYIGTDSLVVDDSIYTPPINVPDTNLNKPNQVKPTCDVITDIDTAFKMIVVVPDSVTMTLEASFINYIYELKQRVVFDPKISQSVLDTECAEAKAEADEIKKMMQEAGAIGEDVVTCEGNVITEISTTLSESKLNPMAPIAAQFYSDCEEIQKTGVIPFDDDEE